MYGKLMSYKQVDHKIELVFENLTGWIDVINENVFNIFAPIKYEERQSKAIEDLKVIPCQISVIKVEDYVEVKTAKLCAKVYDDFKVDFYDAITNELICEDFRGARAPFKRSGNDGIAAEEGLGIETHTDSHKIEVIKTMIGDECFYGLGDKTGHLNKRGYAYEMWNTDEFKPHVESFKTLYKSIPFFITKRCDAVFGIFFDNTFRTYFDMGKENDAYYYFGADDGNLNYYFIYRESMPEVLGEYTKLTGTTPLPQMWTLGYQQSRFSYATADRVEELINKFKEHDIPCDVIHLDIHYMDAFKVFTFHPENYPDPKGLIEKAKAHGIKLVPIVDPGVKKELGYDVYDEGIANGHFATDVDGLPYVNRVWPGDALYPDFSNPKTRTWWGDNHRKLTDLGVQGIWTDMNEPSSFDGPLPDDVQFDNEGLGADHTEIHNVYGHLMSKATYEGMKKITNKRPFVITRAAYSGTQKYSTIWTGDNQSFWDHLRLAIPQQLNLGLSGFSIVGTDIGGFSFDTTKELLSRWIQVGCFSPLFRNHTCDNTRDQEPWTFDKETLDINRKFINLRYKLLPYFYDLLWAGETTGLPVMRPLVMHYENDSNVLEMNDQFMVGEQMMVAPVVHQGARFRAVYLPEGEWYDYDTLQLHTGNNIIIKDAPLDTCPIYIKAGSIIPNYPRQRYVGEVEIKTLILDIYPGRGTFEHIQDDGQSFDYLAGAYNHYCFNQNQTIFEITCKHLGYSKQYETFKIVYHDKFVTAVLADGKALEFVLTQTGIEFEVNHQVSKIEFKH